MGEGSTVRQIVNGHNLEIRVAQRRARTLRPIRLKPLIPTLTMMHSLSVLSGVTLGVRSDGVNDKKKGSDYAILRQWKRWRYSPGVR